MDNATMSLPGEVRVVDSVPGTFCDLFCDYAPGSVALSGGSTAEACYERLASRPFDWSRVEVFFGDDRFVPSDHPDSNEGMVRRVLFDDVKPRVIHPMYRPMPIAAAADAYDVLVRTSPPIDMVHLGLGPDGHTASLFPGSPAVDEQERHVVATGDDLHPHRRLTFTYPAIARSHLAVVTVSGVDKQDAWARVRAGDDLPATRLRAERLVWLVDHAAHGA